LIINKKGNFLGIGADMAVNASIKVDSADPWGILITNGEFTSFIDPHFGNQKADSTQVIVSSTNTGTVRFVNCAFYYHNDLNFYYILKLHSGVQVIKLLL
jgi:hypothetical protein